MDRKVATMAQIASQEPALPGRLVITRSTTMVARVVINLAGPAQVCYRVTATRDVASALRLLVDNHFAYQLKDLCRKNRDGSYATQAQRLSLLTLIANQLHELGFRQLEAQSLKPKHVEALVKRWRDATLAVATIKNCMTALRWWAHKVNRQNVIGRTNDH